MSMFSDVGGIPFVSSSSGEDKGWGQGAMWVFALIVLVFIALFGFNGFGGNRRDGNSSLAEVAALNAINGGANSPNASAAFTELNGRLNGLSQQVSHINDVNDLRDLKSTQAALGLQIAGNRTDTLLNFKDLALQTASGFCDTARAIDSVNYNAAQNTCNIINSQVAQAQRILDEMRVTERDRLRDEIANLRLSNSQARQDMFIERQSDRVIGALTPPCPVPSYPSWPASQPINPFAYGGIPGGSPVAC